MCASSITRTGTPMETHHGRYTSIQKRCPPSTLENTYSLCDLWGFMRRFRFVFRCVGLYICILFQLVEGLSPFLLASRSSMTRTYLGSSHRTSSDGKLPRGTLRPVCTLGDLRTVQQQGGVVEDVSYDGESFLITVPS